MNLRISILMFLGAISLAMPTYAQEQKKQNANQEQSAVNQQASSMLQNAADDSKPREINIGLPSDIAGTAILENGMPVTYDNQSLMMNRAWRQDGSFEKVRSMNIYKTAIYNGTIGVSLSTDDGRGRAKFGGVAAVQTNTFGLVRANAKVFGPLSKGWEYQVSAFLNYDPGSQRLSFSRFADETQIFKGFLNKKYDKGQVGVLYKYIHSEGCNQWNVNPYIYHKDGTVSAYNGLGIGTTNYVEISGKGFPRNPWTGEQEYFDLMKETATDAHSFDILGDHKFNKTTKLTYSARLLFANSGFLNPNYGTIFDSQSQGANNRYVYADNPTSVYEGPIQKGQVAVAKQWKKWSTMERVELEKKWKNNTLTSGLSYQMLDADNAYRSVYATYMTVENGPRSLIHQTWNGTSWVSPRSNEYGAENPNSAIQFYDGLDMKTAVYLMDTWKPTKRLTVDLGARLEWQHIDGYWAPNSVRKPAPDGVGKVLDGKESIVKNWWNKSFTGNVVYKLFNRGGLTADAMMAQVGGNLSNWAQAVDPNSKQSTTVALSFGAYYNSPKISITSKLNYIKRNNYLFAGNFETPQNVTQIERATINYDVHTLGWTTDLTWRPFKGFQLHGLVTLQNPKYGNFDFTLFGDQNFNYTDKTVRGVSKVLVEIDPSYTYKKFRFWGNVRYFSKQYACFSDALYFAPRWEIFAGVDYNYNKQVNFSLSAVNLLSQTGAQGNIAGANTIKPEDASKYYDKPLSGTFIRPFTIEFKTTVKF